MNENNNRDKVGMVLSGNVIIPFGVLLVLIGGVMFIAGIRAGIEANAKEITRNTISIDKVQEQSVTKELFTQRLNDVDRRLGSIEKILQQQIQ